MEEIADVSQKMLVNLEACLSGKDFEDQAIGGLYECVCVSIFYFQKTTVVNGNILASSKWYKERGLKSC